MSDLDGFRAEIRAWLEANCPAEMREPVRDEDDVCWGGRNFVFKNAAQKAWLDACVAKGYTVPDWPVAYGGAGMTPPQAKIWREEMRADRRAAAAVELRHLDARPGAAQIRHRRAEGPLSGASRARRNPLVPGLFGTGFGFGPRLASDFRRRSRAITGSSMARRSGPPMPTRPTGFSAWSAPTRPTSIRASPSCCSTWRAPAFRPSRSC